MRRVLELRTYTAVAGRRDKLAARFRDHTLDLFARHGIEVEGFWEADAEDGNDTDVLVYMLVFPDREAARTAWAEFASDPEWQRVKAESQSDGPLVASMHSVFLRECDFWVERRS
jgi:hypothetical protein